MLGAEGLSSFILAYFRDGDNAVLPKWAADRAALARVSVQSTRFAVCPEAVRDKAPLPRCPPDFQTVANVEERLQEPMHAMINSCERQEAFRIVRYNASERPSTTLPFDGSVETCRQ